MVRPFDRQRRVRGAVLVALVCALGAALGCGPNVGSGMTGRGVIVIAIDGLRADHVGCYGYDRETTPALDALFADGVRFDQVIATAPTMLPSHVSILTGCDPNVARRTQLLNEREASVEERWHVPTEVPHLAVEMLVRGFETGAFLDHDHLSERFGFAPGFQHVESTDEERYTPSDEFGLAVGVERFRQWMRSNERSKPFFAYLHAHDLERVWRRPDPAWDGHFPPRPELDFVPPVGNTDDVYFAIPRSRWRGGVHTLGYYESLYDGHLRKLDEEIEQLIRMLKVEKRYDNTTIVVIGTHGVQFGEAGMLLASGRYSTADVGVPWIISSPAIPPERKGSVVEGVASLLDVAPTLISILRSEKPRGMHGVSQLDAIVGDAPRSAREFAFTSCGEQGGGAVFGDRWTLEKSELGGREGRRSWFGDQRDHSGADFLFYDRSATPFPPLFVGGAQVASPPAETARALEAAGATWDFNMKRTRRVLQGGTLLLPRRDDETIAELQKLGYLGDDL